MKDVKKYSLYLIAIVGIVAIVGIWTMVSGTGKLLTTGTSGESALVADESGGDGALAGEAIKILKIQTPIICVSSSTGKKRCEKDSVNIGYWIYKYEYQQNDCKKIWKVEDYCEQSYGVNGEVIKNTCKEGIGCCKDLSYFECKSNTLLKREVKNQCTGKINYYYYIDCSEEIDDVTGKPKSCVPGINGAEAECK